MTQGSIRFTAILDSCQPRTNLRKLRSTAASKKCSLTRNSMSFPRQTSMDARSQQRINSHSKITTNKSSRRSPNSQSQRKSERSTMTKTGTSTGRVVESRTLHRRWRVNRASGSNHTQTACLGYGLNLKRSLKKAKSALMSSLEKESQSQILIGTAFQRLIFTSCLRPSVTDQAAQLPKSRFILHCSAQNKWKKTGSKDPLKLCLASRPGQNGKRGICPYTLFVLTTVSTYLMMTTN